MSASVTTSYEVIPYESAPIQATHPDNLATLATLFGMRPPPVERCRVLELGCATGGNLTAMADALPGSRFVGFDLSPGQIATAKNLATALGLTNVEFHADSILNVGPDLGLFDYVLCHGVYSWVPPQVQDHILTVCKRNLAPNGVAYVSYNTYPGWHVGAMIRDMVNFHGRRFPEPLERVRQVRGFLDFLSGLVGRDPDSGTYGQVLAAEADSLRDERDTYLFHEYLEEVNQPVYFYQFAERAAAKGLQFLSEARLSAMVGTLPEDVKDTLRNWSADLVEFEQYLDFARNRKFRRTLLCHEGIALERTPGPEIMERFHFTACARPVGEDTADGPDGVMQFRTLRGVTVSTNNPLIKAAIGCLSEVHPRALSFDALKQAADARLDLAGSAVRPFAEALLQCALINLVEMHLHNPEYVAEVSERPAASPLARLQAAAGGWVTNRRHRNLELSGLDRVLIPALDGSRDRAALLGLLSARVADGLSLVSDDGEPIRDPERIRELLSQGLTASLRRMADGALLVG